MKRIHKNLRKVLAIVLVCAMLTMSMGAYSGEVAYVSNDGYMEYRHQIDMKNISIESNELGQLYAINSAETIFSKMKADADAQQLNILLGQYSEISDTIKLSIESGNQIIAIGVTEAPLEYKNGNFERIAMNKEESEVENKHKFSLWTIVEKTTEGQYQATTSGSWSINGIFQGEKYPDDGTDYVLQSTPGTFVRESDDFTAWYNSGEEGVDGDEYWPENGGANYIRYAVDEEPFGLGYMHDFTLVTVSDDNATSVDNRIINSYYIHTWSELDISVSVTASTNKEVSLEITPSIVEDSWQLYSYVSFDF